MSSSLAARIDTVPKLGDAKEAARKLASFVEKAIDADMGAPQGVPDGISEG